MDITNSTDATTFQPVIETTEVQVADQNLAEVGVVPPQPTEIATESAEVNGVEETITIDPTSHIRLIGGICEFCGVGSTCIHTTFEKVGY